MSVFALPVLYTQNATAHVANDNESSAQDCPWPRLCGGAAASWTMEDADEQNSLVGMALSIDEQVGATQLTSTPALALRAALRRPTATAGPATLRLSNPTTLP